jgi:hypothetical protein
MTVPELEILKTHCVMTVINGEIVFEGNRPVDSDELLSEQATSDGTKLLAGDAACCDVPYKPNGRPEDQPLLHSYRGFAQAARHGINYILQDASA